MAEVQPFSAIRYDFNANNGDVSSLIAPPYDVLTKEDKEKLLAKNKHNIVAIDLPHMPPKEEGPEQVYTDAQFALDSWEATGVLVRDEKPAFYVYHQTFEYAGKTYTRKQFIARIRLREFSEGVVLPHEETFGGPKADRLALTRATKCNVSPVFGLYTDPDNIVGNAFAAQIDKTPDATADLDGVNNKLWIVTDDAVIDQVRKAMADKKIYIADGHHRYGTALNYRKLIEDLGGALPDNHPANYVMLVLASMDDPGCVIQGYCRVLTGEGVSGESLKLAWAAGAVEASQGDADLTIYDGASKTPIYLKFTDRKVLDTLAAEHAPAWRELDVAYIHCYLIDKLAVEKFGQAPQIKYVRSEVEAKQTAEEISGVAVLPKATPMDQLRAVSEAGELMPQKSTFFYPKLATGFTINPLG